MTADFLFMMLMGHMLGDYLFQNNWMALNKKKDAAVCGVHCLVYTIMVVTTTFWFWKVDWNTAILIFLLIYLSHFVLDHTDLVDKWLDIINGRSYSRTEMAIASYGAEEKEMMGGYFRAYTALVQTAADNTLHLLAMYMIFIFFT